MRSQDTVPLRRGKPPPRSLTVPIYTPPSARAKGDPERLNRLKTVTVWSRGWRQTNAARFAARRRPKRLGAVKIAGKALNRMVDRGHPIRARVASSPTRRTILSHEAPCTKSSLAGKSLGIAPHSGASNHNIFLKRRYNYINTRYKLLSGKHH
jgi:hypothetical protein